MIKKNDKVSIKIILIIICLIIIYLNNQKYNKNEYFFTKRKNKDIIKFKYNNDILLWSRIKEAPIDWISRSWEKGEFYEYILLSKIKDLNLFGTYVDLGAHMGNHSIFFSKYCSSIKVISIEGNLHNFKYLKKNIKLNKCNNIFPVNKIIDKENDKELYMKYNKTNTGSSTVIGNKVDKETIKDTEFILKNKTITLDKLLMNEKNISLIKIDIENYEYNALYGSIGIIKKHKPVIVIELHKSNPHYEKIKVFLKKMNYISDNKNYANSPTFIYKFLK